MKKKIEILCTLGPGTLNKKFLKFSKGRVDLLRLNMSHLSLNRLRKSIEFIKKYTNIPICIDTEGAQIRTKVIKEKFFKIGQSFKIFKKDGNIKLYPELIYDKIKVNDILDIGFHNLKIRVIKKKNSILCKVISPGKIENNKGVHIQNRKLKISYLTNKDFGAISIGKEFKINHYALSFTDSIDDILKFNKLLKSENKIFKIETANAVRNFKFFLKKGNYFLIDRGDLSKDVKVENIPIAQRNLFRLKKAFKKKKIYVATNLLESMLKNSYPNRGEANDVFNSLEMGAAGLVLAAETAIGDYPEDAVIFLQKMIKAFQGSKS